MTSYMSNVSAFMTLLKKDHYNFISMWKRVLLSSIITTMVYMVIFASVLNERVGYIDGIPFSGFIIPGMIISPCITLSFTSTFSSFNRYVHSKEIESILITPVTTTCIIFAFSFSGSLRGLFISAITYLTMFLHTGVVPQNGAALVFLILLFSLFSSLAGLCLAFITNSYDTLSIIINFILNPMVYLSGGMYSINNLPSPLYEIVQLNPVTKMTSTLRFIFFNNLDAGFFNDLLVIIIALIFAYLACHFNYMKFRAKR